MELVIHVALISVIAYLLGMVFERIKLTKILTYILVGVVAGPAVSNWLSKDMINSLQPIVSFATIFIALLIGLKLKLSEIQKLKKEVILITFIQAFATFFAVAIFTYLAMIILDTGNALAIALILGVVAMATAPAAVLAVVEEFRARGPLTTLLLAIVAIDDAIAIGFFSIIMMVVLMLLGVVGGIKTFLPLPLNELILPSVIGLFLGLIYYLIGKKIKDQTILATLLVLCMLFLFYINEVFSMTTLIPAMILGFIACNFNGLTDETAEKISRAEDILFIIFFMVAGTYLAFNTLFSVGFFTIVFVIARWAGKVLGGALAAVMAGSEEKIRRWLGWGLLPQAGVAIVLAHLIVGYVPQISDMVMTIVVASIIFNAIIGPVGVEFALFRSGEAKERR